MELAFYHGKTLRSRVIEWFCDGPESHAAVIFGDGMVFSSHVGEGVYLRPVAEEITEPDLWERVPVPWTESGLIREWCKSRIGRPYGMIGAVNSGLRIALLNPNEGFCSQVVIEAVQLCPEPEPRNIPLGLNPHDLRCFIRQIQDERKTYKAEVLRCCWPYHYGTKVP